MKNRVQIDNLPMRASTNLPSFEGENKRFGNKSYLHLKARTNGGTNPTFNRRPAQIRKGKAYLHLKARTKNWEQILRSLEGEHKSGNKSTFKEGKHKS